jgi:periplasmic protein TonB
MAKSKAISWAASLAIHATGLVMILIAGFHIAAPEGSVTDKVEFEAVDNNPVQAAAPVAPVVPQGPDQPVPAQPAQAAPQTPPQPEEAPAENTPDEAPPLKTQADESAPPAPEEMPSQNDPTADTAAMPSENPNPSPIESAAPASSPTDNQLPQTAESPAPNPQPTAVDQTAAAGTGAANISGGATIDESKLTEAFGNHKPSYPYMSRLRRQQGTVILRAYVNADGSVNQVSVNTTSGFSALDEEARLTYQRWKYQPGLTGWVIKPFKFSLK